MFFACLYLLSYLIKTILFFGGNIEVYRSYKKKTIIPESVLATLFLATGIWLLVQVGFEALGPWFHLKLSLVIAAIPLGIIGFKKENKILVGLSTAFFIYVLALALTKNITLINFS
jgi:uncharacterized membrane protein SirB2